MLFILKDKNGTRNGHKVGKDYIQTENQVSKYQNCEVQWVLGVKKQINLKLAPNFDFMSSSQQIWNMLFAWQRDGFDSVRLVFLISHYYCPTSHAVPVIRRKYPSWRTSTGKKKWSWWRKQAEVATGGWCTRIDTWKEKKSISNCNNMSNWKEYSISLLPIISTQH